MLHPCGPGQRLRQGHGSYPRALLAYVSRLWLRLCNPCLRAARRNRADGCAEIIPDGLDGRMEGGAGMSEPKFGPVSLTEMVNAGVLANVNETRLWPLGLALMWNYDPDTGEA